MATDTSPRTEQTDLEPAGTSDEVVAGLNRLLADATVFYQKVRHYHWNVTGPHFYTLHDEFEEIYEFWSDAIDELAERLRTVDETPVHTLADILDLTELEEDAGTPQADAMVRRVVADLNALDACIQEVAEKAEAADDTGTVTVLDDLSEQIEEDLWMLRAWLDEG
jgi:starvation-inducible DNA-binding protein